MGPLQSEPFVDAERRLDDCTLPRVVVASDILLISEGLSIQLSRSETVELVGCGAPGYQLLQLLLAAAPDVLVLDIGAKGAAQMAGQWFQASGRAQTVGVAIGKSDFTVSDWARLGVAGFVDDDGSIEQVSGAIQRVARGAFCCSPRTTAQVVSGLVAPAAKRRLTALSMPEYKRLPEQSTSRSRLTPRETQILFDLERGASNKEIARRLGISVSTVKNHIHHLLDKLSVSRRQEAGALVRTGQF